MSWNLTRWWWPWGVSGAGAMSANFTEDSCLDLETDTVFNFQDDFFDESSSSEEAEGDEEGEEEEIDLELPEQHPETEEQQLERINNFFEREFSRPEWTKDYKQQWCLRKMTSGRPIRNDGKQLLKAIPEADEESVSSQKTSKSADGKSGKKKREPGNKVHIRHLPKLMTEEEFLETLEPLPAYNYLHFVSGKFVTSIMNRNSTSFCYINFESCDDANQFVQDYSVFQLINERGQEFFANSQFAINQRNPKNGTRIQASSPLHLHDFEFDANFVDFRELYENEKESDSAAKPSVDVIIKEIDDRKMKLQEVQASPLVNFLMDQSAKEDLLVSEAIGRKIDQYLQSCRKELTLREPNQSNVPKSDKAKEIPPPVTISGDTVETEKPKIVPQKVLPEIETAKDAEIVNSRPVTVSATTKAIPSLLSLHLQANQFSYFPLILPESKQEIPTSTTTKVESRVLVTVKPNVPEKKSQSPLVTTQPSKVGRLQEVQKANIFTEVSKPDLGRPPLVNPECGETTKNRYSETTKSNNNATNCTSNVSCQASRIPTTVATSSSDFPRNSRIRPNNRRARTRIKSVTNESPKPLLDIKLPENMEQTRDEIRKASGSSNSKTKRLPSLVAASANSTTDPININQLTSANPRSQHQTSSTSDNKFNKPSSSVPLYYRNPAIRIREKNITEKLDKLVLEEENPPTTAAPSARSMATKNAANPSSRASPSDSNQRPLLSTRRTTRIFVSSVRNQVPYTKRRSAQNSESKKFSKEEKNHPTDVGNAPSNSPTNLIKTNSLLESSKKSVMEINLKEMHVERIQRETLEMTKKNSQGTQSKTSASTKRQISSTKTIEGDNSTAVKSQTPGITNNPNTQAKNFSSNNSSLNFGFGSSTRNRQSQLPPRRPRRAPKDHNGQHQDQDQSIDSNKAKPLLSLVIPPPVIARRNPGIGIAGRNNKSQSVAACSTVRNDCPNLQKKMSLLEPTAVTNTKKTKDFKTEDKSAGDSLVTARHAKNSNGSNNNNNNNFVKDVVNNDAPKSNHQFRRHWPKPRPLVFSSRS